MGLDIIINSSYNNKVNPDNYAKAIQDTLSESTERIMEEFQKECPVRTGNLRDSHSFEIGEMSSSIHNSAEYAGYVIYGTSRMSPNNYPRRALNTIVSQGVIKQILNSKIHENLGE